MLYAETQRGKGALKKNGILNRELNEAIAAMGHGDIMMIVDAGFPIPEGSRRVDFAIAKDYPDNVTVLKLILGDFIYEKCVVAREQMLNNPRLYEKIGSLIDRCPLETVPHSELIRDYRSKARVFIRTGSFEPWGNIVLVSGIDAPVWFEKEGVVIPDDYKERARYREK